MKSGIDTSSFDPDVRPQDDLFRHVNGRWLATAEIPADRASEGAFRRLVDRSEEALHAIITEAAAADPQPGTEAAKVGDLFASFMATEAIEARGVEPLRADLTRVAAIADVGGLAEVIGGLERAGVSGFAGMYVDTDDERPDRYIVNLLQGGLGLPDESYYREEAFAEVRAAYVDFIATMLGFLPEPPMDFAGDVRAVAERVMALETALAAGHWDVVRSRDAAATSNHMTRAELAELAPDLPWDRWIAEMGAPAPAFETVVVRQPSFFTTLSGLLTSVPLDDWKAWLAWNVVRAAAPYLSDEVVTANFAFYGTTLTGATEQRERWKRGVAAVERGLGEMVGQLYVEQHFPPAAKARMDELVANLVEAYRQSITGLDWMSEETKERALVKLGKFTPKVGYPDEWRDYGPLAIDRNDLLGNVRRAHAFEVDREFGKIGRPIDRGEWFMTPQTVNAYYNPGMNEIVFPAAILQPPFFDIDADDAVNYGGIGAVIGHEIGHGFDDQGSKYDGDGALRDWWTDADRAAFDQRTQALIAQFDQLAPAQAPGHTVNGALTVGENIGDLGGLAVAYRAYEISLAGAEPPVIDGLTGFQRVFLGWAQVWQAKARDAEVLRLLQIDPHSPSEFRCNAVVTNLDEFHEAFGVAEGDALWRSPDERVRIW